MTTSDWVAIVGIAIGLLATTVGSALALAFKMGAHYQGLNQKVDSMATTLDRLDSERIPRLEFVVAQMLVKVDVLWKVHLAESHSPIVPNEIGRRALEASRIGEFAEQRYPEILARVREKRPQNAYQAQEALITVMTNYSAVEDCALRLQDAAFESGHDVDSILLVAALAIRDRVICDLGFDGVAKHNSLKP